MHFLTRVIETQELNGLELFSSFGLRLVEITCGSDDNASGSSVTAKANVVARERLRP